jgi:hypothetical protein
MRLSLLGALFLGLSALPALAFADGATAPTAAVPPPNLDFNFFTDTTAETQARLTAVAPPAEAERRRAMLKTHQALGLTTLGLMAASSVVGQLNYNDMYAAHPAGTGNYIWPHRVLAYGSAAAFATTASFALFAPENESARNGFDTTVAHKIAVSGATLGMLSQIGLGFVTARYAGAGNPRDLSKLARTHQIIGYATTGCMAIAASVWVF